jgi:chromatin assembly factor 1 subunit A
VGVYFHKKSALLDPKNPSKKDETIIDYEMDSEEEWNEQNGEDLAADNKQDEDEDA